MSYCWNGSVCPLKKKEITTEDVLSFWWFWNPRIPNLHGLPFSKNKNEHIISELSNFIWQICLFSLSLDEVLSWSVATSVTCISCQVEVLLYSAKIYISVFSHLAGARDFTKGSSRSIGFKAETLQLPRCNTAIALITVHITWEFYSIVGVIKLLSVIISSGFRSLRTISMNV